MRLLLLAPYPLRRVPGQRFRFEQYLARLDASGIHVDVSPLLSEHDLQVIHSSDNWARKAAVLIRGATVRIRDLARARRYDGVFIHREAFPVGPAVVEWLLSAMGVQYAYDFDDAIYLPNSTDANRAFAALKFAGKTGAIVRHAALVLAGNPELAKWASQYNSSVCVLPTTIDTDRYTPSRARGDVGTPRVCVGWSGSHTTAAHLRPLGPTLARVQERLGVALRVIGAPDFEIPGANVESLPWAEATELQDLAQIDIGLMPLPDDEWARGKCGLKALQYMALGIPTVMSPVGVNTEIAAGGAALLASTPDEWDAAITRLVNDPELRRDIGDAGRRRVVERYSVAANLPLYVDALGSLKRR